MVEIEDATNHLLKWELLTSDATQLDTSALKGLKIIMEKSSMSLSTHLRSMHARGFPGEGGIY